MLKVGIVGATGFSGEELLRILSQHPHVRITYASAKTERTKPLQELFPDLKGRLDLPCGTFDAQRAIDLCDVLFLALPHQSSMAIAPILLDAHKQVIDISADYRLQEPAWYDEYYHFTHTDPTHLKDAVYGLTELNREKIKAAKLLANPGCYPTGALLGLGPLFSQNISSPSPWVIDAKSGVTGAGRKAAEGLMGEIRENFKAYKLDGHQHEGEIRQMMQAHGVKSSFIFVPHLLPLQRGILSTMYIPLDRGVDEAQVRSWFEEYYENSPFVQVLEKGKFPELRDVQHTNQCHIGLGVKSKQNILIVVTAIDNLQKGASGQAVQNMNLMNGFDETAGLN